jgi:hypothetical protein
MKIFEWRMAGWYWLLLGIFVTLCGCSKAAVPGGELGGRRAGDGSVSLALIGYNYTNRHINTFTVDGQGGGNLYVSSPTSGGGGSVCCVPYWRGLKDYKVIVRWQHGACYYPIRSRTSGEVFDELHFFYKEVEVTVDDLSPNIPSNFEVHFYPDGSVKAAVTEFMSMPRLSLRKDRRDSTRYPRCPNDQKPSE